MHAKCEIKTDDLLMIADASAMIKHQPIYFFLYFSYLEAFDVITI